MCRVVETHTVEGEEEITTKIVRERTTICTGGTYHTNRANKEENLLSSTRIAIFMYKVWVFLFQPWDKQTAPRFDCFFAFSRWGLQFNAMATATSARCLLGWTRLKTANVIENMDLVYVVPEF